MRRLRPSKRAALRADIETRHGPVEILVNNAALSSVITPKPFEEISAEE